MAIIYESTEQIILEIRKLMLEEKNISADKLQKA